MPKKSCYGSHFVSKLAKYRIDAKLSLNDVSELTGIKVSTLNNYERGVIRSISARTDLTALKNVFELYGLEFSVNAFESLLHDAYMMSKNRNVNGDNWHTMQNEFETTKSKCVKESTDNVDSTKETSNKLNTHNETSDNLEYERYKTNVMSILNQTGMNTVEFSLHCGMDADYIDRCFRNKITLNANVSAALSTMFIQTKRTIPSTEYNCPVITTETSKSMVVILSTEEYNELVKKAAKYDRLKEILDE